MGDLLIGYIHVNKGDGGPAFAGKNCVSLGYVIGKDYQNRGYGTETLRTITDYMLHRADAVFADHFVGNVPSQRVIEKCGYVYWETYTMYFEALGEDRTCRSYVYEKR